MVTPFAVVAGCEHKNVEPGASTLWTSIKVDPRGKALEADRAPLAVVLVLDVSGSMKGDPIAHVLSSCEIVADLLGERDQLAIVTFSTYAGVRCGLTKVDAAGRTQLRASLRDVVADGNTNIHGGIEVAAGLLMSAAPGLRRVMVVLSDGQPNVGLSSAGDLSTYVRGLRLAISTLGFGLHHDENVLDAIATAGSGRYAYIPDPVLARVDLARAALAHGGIVADQLSIRLSLADGVELVRVLPGTSPLRYSMQGINIGLGDVFTDESRAVALELRLSLTSRSNGRIGDIVVEGRAPNGSMHTATARLDVDVRSGPRIVDPDAQREIILVQSDSARAEARDQADRGAMPAAASILRALAARIDALEGFVRNDGSVIADLREQLQDELEMYERKSTDVERAHQRKTALSYKAASPTFQGSAVYVPSLEAMLAGIGGPVAGHRFRLMSETGIGRMHGNDVVVPSGNVSKRHARIVFVGDKFLLHDLGSTSGSKVNGHTVHTHTLANGDLIELGDAVFRFQLGLQP